MCPFDHEIDSVVFWFWVCGTFILENGGASCDSSKVVVSHALNAVAVRLPPE